MRARTTAEPFKIKFCVFMQLHLTEPCNIYSLERSCPLTWNEATKLCYHSHLLPAQNVLKLLIAIIKTQKLIE